MSKGKISKVLIANRGEISCRAQVGLGQVQTAGLAECSEGTAPLACMYAGMHTFAAHPHALPLPQRMSQLRAVNNSKALCRPYLVQRACKKLGLDCVAVFTEPDALSLHVLGTPESVCLGASPKEYLNAARLIEVAKETGERTGCLHVHILVIGAENASAV